MTLTFDAALAIIHSLSEVSKMPCYSYSTDARHCHRGGKLQKVPGSVCNKCYALRGNFVRPTVRFHLNAREEAMNHPHWVPAMVLVLQVKEQSGFFRWFASGDLRNLGDLLKICAVAKQTPHIRHWLPTHEVGILSAFKRAGFTYPKNLVVRLSADMIDQKPSRALMARLGVLGGAVSKRKWSCPAYTTFGQCCSCRKCWQKSVPVVTYKYH